MSVSRKRVLMIIIAIIGIVCLCFFLSSCSKGRSKEQNFGKGAEKTPKRTQYLQKENVHALGNTAPYGEPTNQNPKNIGLEFTVKTAKLFKSAEEAGIDGKQVLRSNDCHYDIKMGVPVPFDVSKANFLLCDVSVKNINTQDMNITALSLVYLTPDKKDLKLVGFPAYFSKSKSGSDIENPDYYHFELPVRESMDTKIGWWVDLSECKKENLYLMLNYRGVKKLQQYWELGL